MSPAHLHLLAGYCPSWRGTGGLATGAPDGCSREKQLHHAPHTVLAPSLLVDALEWFSSRRRAVIEGGGGVGWCSTSCRECGGQVCGNVVLARPPLHPTWYRPAKEKKGVRRGKRGFCRLTGRCRVERSHPMMFGSRSTLQARNNFFFYKAIVLLWGGVGMRKKIG